MEPVNSDIKVLHVTGDAAAYVESHKRTRRARKKREDPIELDSRELAVPASAPAPAPAPEVPVPVPAVPAPAQLRTPITGGAHEEAKLSHQVPLVKLVPKITKVSNISKKPSIPLTRKKRTFKAKKLSVMIAEADPKTRKARNTIAKKVAAMSLDELRKELETNGLMKKGKKQIPEEMLRSMMRDALTLSHGK